MSDPILYFGKHYGLRVSQVPTSYLLWFVRDYTNPEPYLLAAVQEELRRRAGYAQGGASAHQPQAHQQQPRQLIDFAGVIGRVRRELALRHHPDRGGDVAMMSGINAALDLVERRLTEATA